jgi:hypothetical protein
MLNSQNLLPLLSQFEYPEYWSARHGLKFRIKIEKIDPFSKKGKKNLYRNLYQGK